MEIQIDLRFIFARCSNDYEFEFDLNRDLNRSNQRSLVAIAMATPWCLPIKQRLWGSSFCSRASVLDSERDFNDSNHSYALNWIQARPIQERAASLTASSQKRIRATSSKTIKSESALVKLAARFFFGKKLHRKWVFCDHLKPYKASFSQRGSPAPQLETFNGPTLNQTFQKVRSIGSSVTGRFTVKNSQSKDLN